MVLKKNLYTQLMQNIPSSLSTGYSFHSTKDNVITIKKTGKYNYNPHLDSLRNYRINKALESKNLQRGKATSAGNDCLLHTIFQQVHSILQGVSFIEFASFIRGTLQKTNGEMLSINDELEGTQVISALQAYLHSKTGQHYTIDCDVLFADNDGDIAQVDMAPILQALKPGEAAISLKMIQVNYNHYEPLFPHDISLDLNQSMAELAITQIVKKNLPAYIVNVPLKVDSASEGEDSSDEEITIGLQAFENPTECYRLYPENNAQKTPKRGRVLDIQVPTGEQTPIQEEPLLMRLLDKEVSLSRLQNRIAIAIGMNKMRSLSTRRNNALKKKLNTSFNSSIPVSKIGFLWDGVWQKKDNMNNWVTVSYEEVRRFYKQLKKNNPLKAKAFRASLEKNRAHMIPYREIRDTIKNHEITKGHSRNFRTLVPERDIYITFLDGDLRSFHRRISAASAFAVFDDNYLRRKHTICSTGYSVREPNNLALEVGVLADMAVRQGTAKYLVDGVYFPEPCTSVLIPPGLETLPENFSDPNDQHYASPKEMPRLIKTILRERQLNPQQSMAFDNRGSIVTTTPTRMQRTFECQTTSKNGIILWGLTDFRTMRGINQSHFNARDWALNLLSALQLRPSLQIGQNYILSDKKVLQDLATSLLARLFNAYDPIEVAKNVALNKNLPFQKCMIDVLNDYSSYLLEAIPAQSRALAKPRKNVKNQIEEANRCHAINALWNWADNLNTKTALENGLRLILAIDRVDDIRSAARESAENLVALFKERLCLNYVDLVIGNLAKILNLSSEMIQENMPPLYLELCQGNDIIQAGFIRETKQKINALNLKDFYGVTLVHFAALTGNVGLIIWLKTNYAIKLDAFDHYEKLAFDYALFHCQENGLNLNLLTAVCCNEILNEVQEAVDSIIVDLDEKVIILQELVTKFGNQVITQGDEGLFIHAITKECEGLADALLDNDYDGCQDALSDAILGLAPDIDEKFMKWADLIEVDIEWIVDQLGDTDAMLFKGNMGIDDWGEDDFNELEADVWEDNEFNELEDEAYDNDILMDKLKF